MTHGALPTLNAITNFPRFATASRAEMSLFDQRLQRRKDFLVREVAGGAEENECV
jgi:hypothetical protein